MSAMAMREIRVVGDPVLRTRCEPITERDARVRSLVEDLLETVDAEGRAGLAAYQIGDEGCLSVPGLWYPTKRAWYARVVGEDLDGKEVVVEGTELMARALQHECDHLNGMLFLDRLERSVRKKAMRAMREQLIGS